MNHNERLVDTYRKTLSDVNCVSGHHVNTLPEPYKSQALVYMRQMRDHLEQEFARLGETVIIKAEWTDVSDLKGVI